MTALHPKIAEVTDRIAERSKKTRSAYVTKIHKAMQDKPHRTQLACGNLAHGFAACHLRDKEALSGEVTPNFAIISSYNDMLSAHAPYDTYPALIKAEAEKYNAVVQFAGGVPAMCDGVTQGQPGMELSLFSRDVIAMSTAIGLSHNMFDGTFCLGICDKIVPGLLIGALTFGHLPTIFVPAGPMPSGLPNSEKARIRQLYAEGKVGRDELLKAESESYHSPGTCTFYGTANSNQMLMEMMGLQLPGSSFVNPGTPLRDALTKEAVAQMAKISKTGETFAAIGDIVDEKTLVNGIIGLHATGGSTNHTLHLMAIAAAAGIILDWQDISDLSDTIPLLTRIYPNGLADINHFQAAGGMGFLIDQLRQGGLFHNDSRNIMGDSMDAYCKEPFLSDGSVIFKDCPETSGDDDILRPHTNAFSDNGGLKLLTGNLGKSVIKISAVKPEHQNITAPAVVFHTQDDVIDQFKAGNLNKDFVAVLRFQGPKANGMPELHKLTPAFGVLQDKGFRVALLTDGRMSGASGKVPAAIHLSPEAVDGGPIARIQDGDIIMLNATEGTLNVDLSEDELNTRDIAYEDLSANNEMMGRELFLPLRKLVGPAENGASIFSIDEM